MTTCPYTKWVNNPNPHLVPCGRCGICRSKMYRDWAFRMYHELRTNPLPSYFCTLTYNRKKVPYASDGEMSLRFKDVQLFLKRLRAAGWKAKYIAVGEYGPTTQRPHYHLALFTDATPKALLDNWQNGAIHIGTLNVKSVMYTMKYILHPTPKSKWKEKRERPRAQYSRGLGLGYLSKQIYEYHTSDGMAMRKPVFDGYADGKLQRIPRYYQSKIFTKRERRFRSAQDKAKRERDLLEAYKVEALEGQSYDDWIDYLDRLNESYAEDLLMRAHKNKKL